jgi:hypothetical protein
MRFIARPAAGPTLVKPTLSPAKSHGVPTRRAIFAARPARTPTIISSPLSSERPSRSTAFSCGEATRRARRAAG